VGEIRLLVIGCPNPHGTGGERRSWYILNAMAEVDVDLYVIVDEFCGMTPFVAKAKFEIYRLKGIAGRLLRSTSAYSYPIRLLMIFKLSKVLRKLIQDFQPDLVVSHDELPWNIMAVYMSSSRRPWTAFLNELPGGLPLLKWYARETIGRLDFYKSIMKYALCRKILCALNETIPLLVSKSLEVELKGLGLELRRYIIPAIPFGVNWTLLKKVKPYEKQYDATFVARLVPEKGIYDLIYIWKIVTNIIKDATLCIIGRFCRRKDHIKLKHLVKKYGLENNITFKGYLAENEKFSILKSSKIFLYPSRYDAGPITVLEALACGIPVVAYKVPAIMLNYPTNAVIKANIGHYSEMAYKAISLLMDDELRTKLKQSAISFSSNYTWKRAAEAELEAYKNILNQDEK